MLDGEAVSIAFDRPPAGMQQCMRQALIAEGGQAWRLSPWRAGGAGGADASNGAILSPMPGKVIAVSVAEGDHVTMGQKLLTLEAMKMEHGLVAPFDGTISEFTVERGSQVSEGALLVKIEKAEDA